ncbi:MAG: hypothetical protein LUG51_16055 [Tannerellaceae bacterium]|nr:hypothetical protein [Tannerellaceae bacterium]
MRINKDLVDAVMMVSFIILVLTGTSDFENVAMKDTLMAVLGVVTIAMVVLRIVYARNNKNTESHH